MSPKKVTKPTSSPSDSKIQQLESQLARALADYQNLEKRVSRDSAAMMRFASASLLSKILDIRDHLASAASHLPDPSLTMILAQLDKLLSDEGVVMVKTDTVFDPSTMECSESAPGEKDKVISVQRPGYLLGDRLLRSARVTVGNGQINNKHEK